MTETPQEAFLRGETAGRIEQRLAGHDVHLAKINGSIADSAEAQSAVAKEISALRLAVQSLADAHESRKELEEAHREADFAWTPLQRLAVGAVTIGVAASLVIAARGGR